MLAWLKRSVIWPLEFRLRLLRLIPAKHALAWRTLAASVGTVELPVKGLARPVRLRGGTSDFEVFREVFAFREYDLPIPEPSVIVDCGANIGLTSLFFRSKYPNARIVAVEADASNAAMACLNLAGDNLTSVMHAAVWPTVGFVSVSGGEAWSKRVSEGMDGEPVQAVTIPDVMERHGINRIGFLKIDIEGAEKQLFSGDVSWLAAVRCIAIELHERYAPGCTDTFLKAITPFGFKVTTHGMLTLAVH